MRILVDMDGVITDFHKTAWELLFEYFPNSMKDFPKPEVMKEFYLEYTYDDLKFQEMVRHIQAMPGFFRKLAEVEGAIEALHDLEKDHQVFICTAPLLENPTCSDDKLAWVDAHLGGDWIRRTIITKDKTVVDGDILIDDKPIITGITDEPIWQRVLFDQPYNKNIVGRRLNWSNYKKVIDSIW